MFEQFRQARTRLIVDSEARLVEVRPQAEEERAHYMNQVQMRQAEIHRLHWVIQQADRNAYEGQNAARVAAEELARGQLMNARPAARVATPPPQFVGRPRLPPNASPRRTTVLRQLMDFGGEGPGYDREEDLMWEELAHEGGRRAKQQRRGERADSNAGSSWNSSMIAWMPTPGWKGTIGGVQRDRGVGGRVPHDH